MQSGDEAILARAFERARILLGWTPSAACDLSGTACEIRNAASSDAKLAAGSVGIRSAIVEPAPGADFAAFDELMLAIGATGLNVCAFGSLCPSLSSREAAVASHINSRSPSSHLATLMRCSRCGVAYYCGESCQKAHWPAHKTVCASIASTRSAAGVASPLQLSDVQASAKSVAFNQVTTSMILMSEFCATLTEAWQAPALLVEVDDAAIAAYAAGGSTAAVRAAAPLALVITPWRFENEEGGEGGRSAVGKLSGGVERPAVSRLRLRSVDCAVFKLLTNKKSPSSVAVVFATASGDLAKCVLLPAASGAVEGFLKLQEGPSAFATLRKLEAVVVEPCVGNRERRVGGPDSVQVMSSMLFQPTSIGGDAYLLLTQRLGIPIGLFR